MLQYEFRTGPDAINHKKKSISIVGIGEVGKEVINNCLDKEFNGLDYHHVSIVDDLVSQPDCTIFKSDIDINDPFIQEAEHDYSVSSDDSIGNDSSFFALSNTIESIDISENSHIGECTLSKIYSDNVYSEICSRNRSYAFIVIILNVYDESEVVITLDLLDHLSSNDIQSVLLLTGNNTTLIENPTLVEQLIEKSGSIVDLVSKVSIRDEDEYWYICQADADLCTDPIKYLTQTVSGNMVFNLDANYVKKFLSKYKYIRFFTYYFHISRADGGRSVSNNKYEIFNDIEYEDLKKFESLYYYLSRNTGEYLAHDIDRVISSDKFKKENDITVVVTSNKKLVSSSYYMLGALGTNNINIKDIILKDTSEVELKESLLSKYY